ALEPEGQIAVASLTGVTMQRHVAALRRGVTVSAPAPAAVRALAGAADALVEALPGLSSAGCARRGSAALGRGGGGCAAGACRWRWIYGGVGLHGGAGSTRPQTPRNVLRYAYCHSTTVATEVE